MLLAAGFIVIASIGKVGGCYIGGRLGGMTARESLAVGIGMNARGSTEVIVASVGLSMGVLSRDLYTLIVFMAVFTTMIMPPLLRWALKRIPPSEEEQARLEHAERESREFVPNVERLLVAVDGGNNGKLAAHIAGLLAGSRGIPTTVLDLSPAAGDANLKEIEQIAKTSAELASLNVHAAQTDPSKPVERPSLIAQTATEEFAEAVLKEARKGYEMLILGVTHAFGAEAAKPGQFHPGIEKLVAEFSGATAIVLARKGGPADAEDGRLDILLPTTSTDYSRRAAEVAIAIAKGGRGTVTALHVMPPPDENIMLRWMTAANMRRPQIPVPTSIPSIEHARELGERHGVPVTPQLVCRASPEAAIQDALRKCNYDLMVLGVTARPGEGRFFGYNTGTILERSRCSFLVVSS
jgi:nucleotide-binding universal stress UspA family protein